MNGMVAARGLIMFFLFMCPLFGIAGNQSGKVALFVARASDGLHYFVLEGTPQNRPSCASASSYFMIKNENSPVGRTQIAMVMAAYAAGKPIGVAGSNTCTRWGDGEDVDVIQNF